MLDALKQKQKLEYVLDVGYISIPLHTSQMQVYTSVSVGVKRMCLAHAHSENTVQYYCYSEYNVLYRDLSTIGYCLLNHKFL